MLYDREFLIFIMRIRLKTEQVGTGLFCSIKKNKLFCQEITRKMPITTRFRLDMNISSMDTFESIHYADTG